MSKAKPAYGTKYLNHFLKSKCAPDILLNKLYPNHKELTESYGAFEATTHLPPGYEWNNPGVTVVCVGDGHRPQTAATFAYRTAWQCYSVDPQLRPRIYNIKRLSLHRCKVEEFGFHEKKNVLLVCVHSHAPLDKAVQSITNYNQLAIISIPCCVHQKIDRPPDLVYRDENIHSPKNEVLVWKSIEEK